MKVLMILSIPVLGLFAQPSQAKNYIVGGQEVDSIDPIRKSTVGIFSPSADHKSGSLCTGTLIKKNIALTAAHCIQNNGIEPELIFGRNLHSSTAIHQPAEAIIVNSKWRSHAGKGMDQGDIALIKFKGKIPSGYKKVSSIKSDSDIRNGSKVILAGYGISNAQNKSGAGILRRANVRVENRRAGKSEMILDQTRGRGACHGDSGGPAYLNKGGKIVLAGITNRGFPNGSPDDCAHKVVYTKVPAYRSWIQKNEKRLEQSGGPKKVMYLTKSTKVFSNRKIKRSHKVRKKQTLNAGDKKSKSKRRLS